MARPSPTPFLSTAATLRQLGSESAGIDPAALEGPVRQKGGQLYQNNSCPRIRTRAAQGPESSLSVPYEWLTIVIVPRAFSSTAHSLSYQPIG